MSETFSIERGSPFPFGVTKEKNGFNFSIFSRHAEAVSLCLFKPDDLKPFIEFALDPEINKTGDVWHIFLYDVPDNYHYGYRIDGAYEPLKGFYYDHRLILLDPYAKKIIGPSIWADRNSIENNHYHKAAIFPFEPFDWKNDKHPCIPKKDLIIYEMHVRGFTQDPSSGVANPGTFLGIIDKIPYLKSLGINAIELMPIHAFNEIDNPNKNPKTGELLVNYWGYSTKNFFSPMNRYGTGKNCVLSEFKTLVRELHANGIEVILDVVYNHTAEGNQKGPIISFKGIENPVYYLLGPNGEYYNFSGCGNTFNCNHPVVRELIRNSLRYWVIEMHVDGFRFDLASILNREHDGLVIGNAPIVDAITRDPILANTKLIAEPWDAGGLYQVGSFPGKGIWSEWNGKYRDAIRRFIKGTEGEAGNFATRICGSEDLYGKEGSPACSINFITAHDGFTLADLVSYNEKHNEENGEDNRDGLNDNDSWNCGVEGQTDDPDIIKLRKKQMKNFIVALLISQGIPMLLMGDEYGHSKFGNNNSWGLDDRINWFQWDTLEKNRDIFNFFQSMISFRKKHSILVRSQFLGNEDIIWHGTELNKPNWNSRLIACTLPDSLQHYSLYIAFNADHETARLQLPARDQNHEWRRIIDTSLDSPDDFVEESKETSLDSSTYDLSPYSALILKGYDP